MQFTIETPKAWTGAKHKQHDPHLKNLFVYVAIGFFAVTALPKKLLSRCRKQPKLTAGKALRKPFFGAYAQMNNFGQNGLWGLQKFAEKDQNKKQEQIEIQEQTTKKESSYLPRVLLLVSAAIVVIGIVWLFGPSLKGSGLTEKAAGLLSRDVSLSAISYSEDNPVAIVNSKIVHEGDVVGEVTVVKIHKDKVDLERAGRRWSQSLPEAEEGVHSGISGVPVLLVLGAEGCRPCREMKPILKELKSKYAKKFEVRYIDVWKNRAAGAQYGVRAIPTQIFYDDKGREAFRHVGFYTKQEILAVWRQIGVKL